MVRVCFLDQDTANGHVQWTNSIKYSLSWVRQLLNLVDKNVLSPRQVHQRPPSSKRLEAPRSEYTGHVAFKLTITRPKRILDHYL